MSNESNNHNHGFYFVYLDEKETKHAFQVTFEKKWKDAKAREAESAVMNQAAGPSDSPAAAPAIKQVRIHLHQTIKLNKHVFKQKKYYQTCM